MFPARLRAPASKLKCDHYLHGQRAPRLLTGGRHLYCYKVNKYATSGAAEQGTVHANMQKDKIHGNSLNSMLAPLQADTARLHTFSLETG